MVKENYKNLRLNLTSKETKTSSFPNIATSLNTTMSESTNSEPNQIMKSSNTTSNHTNLSYNLNSITTPMHHQEKNNNHEDLYVYKALQPILTNPPLTDLTSSKSKSDFFISSSISTLRKTKSSPTEPNDDIPYKITSPLPPIFNSQLCHLSKPIPYLSNSLPNLSILNWDMITGGTYPGRGRASS